MRLRACLGTDLGAPLQPFRPGALQVRELERQMSESRAEICERASKLEISMELFPLHEPWKFFPWEAQFRPRSEL